MSNFREDYYLIISCLTKSSFRNGHMYNLRKKNNGDILTGDHPVIIHAEFDTQVVS